MLLVFGRTFACNERCGVRSSELRRPERWLPPWLRHGKLAVDRRLVSAQADQLPCPMPFFRQGIWWYHAIIGFKAEAPIIGRVAKNMDLSCAIAFQVLEALTNECATDAPSLPAGSDRKRSEERDFVGSSGDAAHREDDMSNQRLISQSDKRESDCFFSQQFPYQRQQILIRERVWIQFFNRSNIRWQTFAYFNFVDHFSVRPGVPLIPKFAPEAAASACELRNRNTRGP